MRTVVGAAMPKEMLQPGLTGRLATGSFVSSLLLLLCINDDLIQLFNFRWNISASIEFNYLDFVIATATDFNIIIYLKQLIIMRSDTLACMPNGDQFSYKTRRAKKKNWKKNHKNWNESNPIQFNDDDADDGW